MLKSIARLKVQWKLRLMVIIFLTGFICAAAYMYSLTLKVSINGPVYKEIIMNKDLVADILPPPEYIIEPYIITSQMKDEKNPESLKKLILKFASLKKNYFKRQEFWRQVLDNEEIKTAMLEKSYEAAVIFFDIVEKQYIPALKTDDAVKIDTLINGDLKDAYEKHRSAIDTVVKLANNESSTIEKNVKETIRWTNISTICFALIILGLVISLSFYIQIDITEHRRAEDEIHQLNQELEQRVLDRTNQLEASNKELEAFAYSVSHDLRAPLRHIDGYIALLTKKTVNNLDDQSRNYLSTISQAATKMGDLIDDLLSFSRLGRKVISLKEVDLGPIIHNIIQELEPEIVGRDIQWRIEKLPVVKGDASLLRIVMMNLISNAVKFTRPREQAVIEVGSESRKEKTIVFIRDNGVGFDQQYADNLFGVFQRLHRADEFEGTGVGLAMVQRIIHRHGGRVWAEGKVGQGAVVYFSLPQSVKGIIINREPESTDL